MTEPKPDRSLNIFYWLTIAVFGLTLLQSPTTSGEWVWDSANALGFFAYPVLLYLFIDTGSGPRQKIHQWLSYLGLAAVVGHIAWLWIPDTTVWNYLSFDAPHYMIAALLALVGLVLITLISLPTRRRFWHGGLRHGVYRTFRTLHEWLALAVLGLALWHMAGSGFYLSGLESALLAALSLSVWWLHKRSQWPSPDSDLARSLGALLVPVAFVALKAAL